MEIKLEIQQILLYYDFPEIFTAKDAVDTKYLCLLTNIINEEPNYISTPISNKRLSNFINGSEDLREIFTKPESNRYFEFTTTKESIIATEYPKQKLPETLLPDKGFVLRDQIINEDEIIQESIEYKNAIVHLAVSDEKDNYSIEADDLGDVLKLYQVMLENIFKKEVVNRKVKDKKSTIIPQNYTLRAFDSSYSSFNVHLYSKSQTDLFGNAIVEIGLEKLNNILSTIKSEDGHIELLQSVKGHSVSTLKKLVRKIIDNNLKLKHKWYAPNQEKVHYQVIDYDRANKLYDLLNSKNDLSEETKEFFGHLVQVDVDKGTWRIHNLEDEKEYSGESTGEKLQGVTVETVNYKIVCTEQIEIMRVSENEKTKYILTSIEEGNAT